jgi:hypothetical protein
VFGGRAKTHVKRTLIVKAEATIGSVELWRADAEIEEDTVRWIETDLTRRPTYRIEIFLNRYNPIAEPREARSGGLDRRRIGVDTQQTPSRGRHFQHALCMTSRAKRGVDVSTSGLGLERFYGFGEENGCVEEPGVHCLERENLGELQALGFESLLLAQPGFPTPNFNPAVQSHDHGVATEAGMLAQEYRHADTTLSIEITRYSAAEK